VGERGEERALHIHQEKKRGKGKKKKSRNQQRPVRLEKIKRKLLDHEELLRTG